MAGRGNEKSRYEAHQVAADARLPMLRTPRANAAGMVPDCRTVLVPPSRYPGKAG